MTRSALAPSSMSRFTSPSTSLIHLRRPYSTYSLSRSPPMTAILLGNEESVGRAAETAGLRQDLVVDTALDALPKPAQLLLLELIQRSMRHTVGPQPGRVNSIDQHRSRNRSAISAVSDGGLPDAGLLDNRRAVAVLIRVRIVDEPRPKGRQELQDAVVAGQRRLEPQTATDLLE